MNSNSQPIEKPEKQHDGQYLDVVSVFHTIQGEGPFSGRPAIFIRLAGCNLQCPGCDTDYTSNREVTHISDIVDRVGLVVVQNSSTSLVVITGGEPFRQNISPLCQILLDVDLTVQIETNGTLPPSPLLPRQVHIVCSPKTGKINPHLADRMNSLKYVAHADYIADDGLPLEALDHTCKPYLARPPKEFDGEIYLQPMDSYDLAQNQRNIQAVRDACLSRGYKLQLQIHKLIGVE